MGSFCLDHKRAQLKSTEEFSQGDAKFKGKMTLALKNDIRNLVNFDATSQKSESFHFDGLLLPKACKV